VGCAVLGLEPQRPQLRVEQGVLVAGEYLQNTVLGEGQDVAVLGGYVDATGLAEDRDVLRITPHCIEQPQWIDLFVQIELVEEGKGHRGQQQRGQVEGVGGPHRGGHMMPGWWPQRIGQQHAGLRGQAHDGLPAYWSRAAYRSRRWDRAISQRNVSRPRPLDPDQRSNAD